MDKAGRHVPPVTHWVALPPVVAAVALYLLLFLSTRVSLPGVFSGYNGQRWGALMLLAAVLAVGRTKPSGRALGLPAALLITGLLATVLSAHPAEAAAVLMTHVGLLWLAWASTRAAGKGKVRVVRGWCCVAVAVALLYASVVVVGLVTLIAIGHLDTRELFLGFANRRFFLQLTTPLLPCLIALALDRALVPRFRALAGFAALLWALLIWFNDGSGALYALALGLSAAGALLGMRRLASWAAAIASVMAVGWLLLWLAGLWLPLITTIQAATVPGLSGRPALWAKALWAIGQKPLVGWGPGNFAFFTDVRNGHPHNMLLDWAVGYGLIGLALAGMLLWRVFQPWRLRARVAALPDAQRHYSVALTIASLAGLAHANVSGLTVMPMAQVLLATTLGLCAGALGRGAPATRANHHLTRLMPLLLAGALLITAAWSMANNCAVRYPNQAGHCAYAPAFWLAYPSH